MGAGVAAAHTWRKWPLGSVSDWVEAIGTTGAFIATYLLLRHELAEREEARHERISGQARLVGGHISCDGHHIATMTVDGVPDDVVVVQLHIVNSSDLSVRSVAGSLYMADTGEFWADFPPIPVVAPGTAAGSLTAPASRHTRGFVLRLRYDDDSGIRWEKYGPEGLRRVG